MDLAGNCGSNSPSSVVASVTAPTSDTITYSVDGKSHTATRQSDGGIYDQNASGSCRATLAKQSSISSTSRGSVASASLVLVLALLAMLVVVRI
jgi:cobalamin biosynthesis Mg chelatase CobN